MGAKKLRGLLQVHSPIFGEHRAWSLVSCSVASWQQRDQFLFATRLSELALEPFCLFVVMDFVLIERTAPASIIDLKLP